jgi:hypothetical protein
MLKEWLFAMLGSRDCSQPDGRWLYKYRLLSSEYQSLKDCLLKAARSTSVSLLTDQNKYFAALFVLYASEWWRREYDGGPWKWGPILASLQLELDTLPPHERSEVVRAGFAFWGLRPVSGGKRFFGTVVAHGGLPLKLIGDGGSRLATVMGTVLNQAARYGWNEDQVVDAVADHAPSMPESLRHDEVYRLLALMVLTTLNLKIKHQLGGVQNPIERLDNEEPHWRDDYPLQIDDSAAMQLLTSMVKQASQVSSELLGAAAVFQVERTLTCSVEGEWRLQSQVAHPHAAPADALAQQFGLGKGLAIPRYFEVDVTAGEREVLTSGRLLLGSERTTVALNSQRRRWLGRAACNEHILHLRSSGHDVVEGGIALPGGESLINNNDPWAFVVDGAHYRFAGAGDLRLPGAEAVLATTEDCTLEPLGDSAASIEQVGQLDIDGEQTLKLWRTTGSVRVFGISDGWVVRLGQSSMLSGSLVLEGRRAAYPTRPWPVFRGKPRVVRYDDQGQRTPMIKGLRWFAAGSKTAIDPAHYTGPVDLQVFENEERTGRFRFFLISARSSESFVSGDLTEEATIDFSGWGFTNLSVDTKQIGTGALQASTQGGRLSLHTASMPPRDLLVYLHWSGSPYECRVLMPYPATGGRAFDTAGVSINNGSAISLRRAASVSILVFDQNPNEPKKYEVELELKGDARFSRSNSLPSRHTVPTAKGFAELRLLDLYSEIETLLSLSDELDAHVEFRLIAGTKPSFSISITRYDVALHKKVMAIALAEEDLRHMELDQVNGCKVLASSMLDPAEEPLSLTQMLSDNTSCGVWNITALKPELAPWLIYPAADSTLEFRPLSTGGGFASTDEEDGGDGARSGCTLARAIRIPDATMRLDAIDAVLVTMAGDYNHDSWSMFDGLWTVFGQLPLCSIDTFKALATRPEVVVAMLFRSDLHKPQLSIHVSQLKQQLGVALELVGMATWRKEIDKFKTYWTAQLGESTPKDTINILLRDRLEFLARELPGLQINIACLQFEFLDDAPSQIMLQLQRDIQTDKGVHLTRLWHGEDSLLQRLLLRVHADDVTWPEPRFFIDKAAPAFRDFIQSCPSPLRDTEQLIKFFWVQNNDFKISAANIPVLCALWCALDLPLDWWRAPVNRLALQRLRAFDPLWFEDAYQHAFAACIGLSLIDPAPGRTHVSTSSVEGGGRIFRVQRGTVQRIREKRK